VLQLKLYYLFYDIRSQSGGVPPPVVVTGYYNPLSSQCANLSQRLTPAELTWLATEHANLNRTIQNVASQFSYVRFAPVSFSGHDICSTTPWVQGINDPAPFHPNATGQQAIAGSVLRALGR
jgi:lysophospholipase L1-like esterase